MRASRESDQTTLIASFFRTARNRVYTHAEKERERERELRDAAVLCVEREMYRRGARRRL